MNRADECEQTESAKVCFTPISIHVINIVIKHLLISLAYFVPGKAYELWP